MSTAAVTYSDAITLYTPSIHEQHCHTTGDGESVTPGKWRGRVVWVAASGWCPVPGHKLFPMLHYGRPTAFLQCDACGGVAPDPDNPALGDGA